MGLFFTQLRLEPRREYVGWPSLNKMKVVNFQPQNWPESEANILFSPHWNGWISNYTGLENVDVSRVQHHGKFIISKLSELTLFYLCKTFPYLPCEIEQNESFLMSLSSLSYRLHLKRKTLDKSSIRFLKRREDKSFLCIRITITFSVYAILVNTKCVVLPVNWSCNFSTKSTKSMTGYIWNFACMPSLSDPNSSYGTVKNERPGLRQKADIIYGTDNPNILARRYTWQ